MTINSDALIFKLNIIVAACHETRRLNKLHEQSCCSKADANGAKTAKTC